MRLHIETASTPLPASVTGARLVAKRRFASFPREASFDCPVLLLLVEFEELVKLQRQEDAKWTSQGQKRRPALLEKIGARLSEIAEEASQSSPTSYQGAAFQIMLASCEPGGVGGWGDDCEERFNRLIYRAMDRFDDAFKGFPVTRDYLLPKRLDPKNEEVR